MLLCLCAVDVEATSGFGSSGFALIVAQFFAILIAVCDILAREQDVII